MILESAFLVFIGFLLMFLRLSWKSIFTIAGHPGKVDIFVFVLTYLLHSGTFSGVMVAAIASLLFSGFLSVLRWSCGYISNGFYYPGKLWQWDCKK